MVIAFLATIPPPIPPLVTQSVRHRGARRRGRTEGCLLERGIPNVAHCRPCTRNNSACQVCLCVRVRGLTSPPPSPLLPLLSSPWKLGGCSFVFGRMIYGISPFPPSVVFIRGNARQLRAINFCLRLRICGGTGIIPAGQN